MSYKTSPWERNKWCNKEDSKPTNMITHKSWLTSCTLTWEIHCVYGWGGSSFWRHPWSDLSLALSWSALDQSDRCSCPIVGGLALWPFRINREKIYRYGLIVFYHKDIGRISQCFINTNWNCKLHILLKSQIYTSVGLESGQEQIIYSGSHSVGMTFKHGISFQKAGIKHD